MQEKLPGPLLNVIDSGSSELYRVLFSGLMRQIADRPIRSIAITSSVKGEGKTTTAIHLARVAARDFGKKVLLLEGDLKNPQFGKRWSNPEGTGLYHLLTKEATLEAAIQMTDQEGFEVLPAGRFSKKQDDSGSALALGLKRILQEVSVRYDFVFVDCPPVHPLVDTRIIAEAVDGVIMVIQSEGPPRSVVASAVESLPSGKVLGVVLNGMKTVWPRYSYGYTY